jgi:DNA processing protein
MDVQTAVALTLVPVPRTRIAGALRDAARTSDPAAARLDRLLPAVGVASPSPSTVTGLLRRASNALRRAADQGAHAVPWGDPRYPTALAAIPDPPAALWIRGDIALASRPAVAIVGSRAATSYALEVASRLASSLAAGGVVVVSGLARGVDSAAHRGILDAGGRTVAVLGSGVDVIYPPENAALAARIADSGVLLSELPPGCPPKPWHFPLRNRIISGLSLAVVVVEASARSGSLTTARAALDQGREVMVVPGNVLSGRNKGAHQLIKDGAKIVEQADDILNELGGPLVPGVVTDGSSDRKRLLLNDLERRRDPVLRAMAAGELYEFDTLIELSGLDSQKLLPRLMELELSGQISRFAGGRFGRTGR